MIDLRENQSPESARPKRRAAKKTAKKGLEKRAPVLLKDSVMHAIKGLVSDVDTARTPFANSDLVTEVIVTALKAVQARIGRGDMKLLSRSLRELRYAFKIFQAYRGVRKVTIFGSARTPTADPLYQMTKNFAERIVAEGFMVITGAGPGIMQAGNEGAGAKNSFGVNIRLPFEQHPNPFIAKQPTYIDCRYFFTRKLVFVKEADATVFFPGGYGTLDEAFELLTLVQTGKCDPIPLIFVDRPGGTYWQSLSHFIAENLLASERISPEDVNIFKVVTSVSDAVAEISRFYRNYHSMRYVRALLVMRLKNPLPPATLKHINTGFKDILTTGHFTTSGPLPDEENEPHLANFPRLVFAFNRMNNGRLRTLIDVVNDV